MTAMTEQEWLACTDPKPMLEFIRGKASDRKLRLFAVACCRCGWHLLPDERSRNAVVVAEQFADGKATWEQLRAAWAAAMTAAKAAMRVARQVKGEAKSVADQVVRAAWEAAWGAKQTAAFVVKEGGEIAKKAWPDQTTFFCDIFGSPFRPVSLSPSWLVWNDGAVRKMAQAIYDERAFDRLFVLADALEDAGCHNADILAHCRQPGPHVRGCWVVDLVLGKS
jgi:hypothetical protein